MSTRGMGTFGVEGRATSLDATLRRRRQQQRRPPDLVRRAKGVGLGMRVMRVPEREVATRGGRGGSPSDDGDSKRMDASGICQERFDLVT